MDVRILSSQYIVKCRYCNCYITHSLYIGYLRNEKLFGIKIKRYVARLEYCNVYVGTERAIHCNNCEKIIGTFNPIKRGIVFAELLSVKPVADVS